MLSYMHQQPPIQARKIKKTSYRLCRVVHSQALSRGTKSWWQPIWSRPAQWPRTAAQPWMRAYRIKTEETRLTRRAPTRTCSLATSTGWAGSYLTMSKSISSSLTLIMKSRKVNPSPADRMAYRRNIGYKCRLCSTRLSNLSTQSCSATKWSWSRTRRFSRWRQIMVCVVARSLTCRASRRGPRKWPA